MKMSRITGHLFAVWVLLMAITVGVSAKTQIQLMMPDFRESRVEQAHALKERFERENPDIEIDLVFMSGNTVERITILAAAGVLPDVFWQGRDAFLVSELALDLRPFMERDGITGEQYFPAFWNSGQTREKHFAMVNGGLSTLVYYNKQLFDEAGIAYPQSDWTWSEKIDLGRKLTRRNSSESAPAVWGLNTNNGYTDGWPTFYNGPWAVERAGRVVANLNSPANERVLEDLRNARFVERTDYRRNLETDAGNNFQAFAAGRTATYVHHNTSVANLAANQADVDWGVLRLPVLQLDDETVQPASLYSTENLLVSKETEHPEAAWKLVKFFSSAAMQTWAFEEGYFLPANRAALTPSLINSVSYDLLEFYENLSVERGWHNFPFAQKGEMTDAVQRPLLNPYQTNPNFNQPISQVLEEADRLVNAIFRN